MGSGVSVWVVPVEVVFCSRGFVAWGFLLLWAAHIHYQSFFPSIILYFLFFPCSFVFLALHSTVGMTGKLRVDGWQRAHHHTQQHMYQQ